MMSGRNVSWAIVRPCSTLVSVPPQTGSSCSTDSTPPNPASYRRSTTRAQST